MRCYSGVQFSIEGARATVSRADARRPRAAAAGHCQWHPRTRTTWGRGRQTTTQSTYCTLLHERDAAAHFFSNGTQLLLHQLGYHPQGDDDDDWAYLRDNERLALE